MDSSRTVAIGCLQMAMYESQMYESQEILTVHECVS